jgi:hypothetical protein
MSEFQREERYIVFKKSHLSGEQLRQLEFMTNEGRGRASSHDLFPTVECVVIESDWPEYDPVWAMLEQRVSGEQP